MIEWLSNNYGVSINVIILKYIKTKGNEEFIARTVIIPEEIEKEITKNGKYNFQCQMNREVIGKLSLEKS